MTISSDFLPLLHYKSGTVRLDEDLLVRVQTPLLIVWCGVTLSSDEMIAKSKENFEGRREKTGISCDPRSSPPKRAIFHPTHTL